MTGSGLEFLASDGTRLVYDDEGEGPAVVFVHGYSSDRTYWKLQRQPLIDAGFRVIAIDQRNHGDSEKTERGQRMSRHGMDLHEFLHYLRLDKPTVVGHSMGVSAVLAMFSLFGTSSVGRMVAEDQSPCIINQGDWKYGVLGVTWDNVWASVTTMKYGHPELEPPLPAKSAEALGPGYRFRHEHHDHATTRQLLIDHFVADWRDILPTIDMPTLWITASTTPFYDPEMMSWVASQVPDGSFAVFENSGHSPHVWEFEKFNKMLIGFVAQETTSAEPDTGVGQDTSRRGDDG
jgi:non-heme chloroperoxidase